MEILGGLRNAVELILFSPYGNCFRIRIPKLFV